MLDVSYVGSQSRHNPRRVNLNSPAYGTTFTAAAQDPTRFANGVIPATEPGLPPVYASAGANFSGANILSTDFLRPYQGYGDIPFILFDGNSSFNSLQVGVQRRFARGVTFGAAYTLSRVTTTVSDDATYTNIVTTRNDYGLARISIARITSSETLSGTFPSSGISPATRGSREPCSITGFFQG